MDYRTANTPLASYLALEFELIESRPEQGKVFFTFEDTPELRKCVEDYFNDASTAMVSPKRFAEKMRALKEMVFAFGR